MFVIDLVKSMHHKIVTFMGTEINFGFSTLNHQNGSMNNFFDIFKIFEQLTPSQKAKKGSTRADSRGCFMRDYRE